MADRDENGGPAAPEAVEDASHDTDERPALDPEREERRRRALAMVRSFGDPVLRASAVDVTRFDESLLTEIARMDLLMADAFGLGLASTQLGVMHRLFIYRVGADAPLVAVVNPRLEWASEEVETAEEGCLSLPLVTVDVERPVHVRVSAQDHLGDSILLEASGLEARVVQHEMDHLDGVLILDRTSKEQRKEALRTLRGGGESHSHDPVSARTG